MEFMYTAAYLLMTILFQTVNCSSNIKRHDICKPFNQKRVYAIIGSRGIIFAKNDIFSNSTSNDSFHKQCSLHIASCPSCMINLRFKDVHLTCTASSNDDDPPQQRLVCDSVCVVEPTYSTRPPSPRCVNDTVENGSVLHYKSSTGQVNLNFVYRQPYRHAFTAEYWITRNIQVAEVKPEFHLENISYGGYISTPFFPLSYPDDLTFEQVIKCKLSGCTIHLIFVDFQIAEGSVVEFYDSDQKRLGITGGYTFRPPVVLSSGPVLYIKFFANGGSSTGYKAQYSYIRGNVSNSILKPNTNCGGIVENRGGAITMMHMVEELEPDVVFDCIWLFRTIHKYTYNSKSQNLYMKVIMLKDLVESNLIIREGRTSNGRQLQWKNGSNNTELVVAIEVGFYVRLTGTFNFRSRLEIAYAAFSRSKTCSTTNEFFCKNERCIPSRLQCDGFDHCGDNSDESAECWEDHDSESKYMDKSWYAYKSNYYFPNNSLYSKRYHILLGCFIGFILFFIMVLLIIYKIAARYHFQMDFHNRLISISQLLLEDHSSSSETNRLHSLTDEPPAYEPPPEYEAPPNYDEAIKMCKVLMINKDNDLNEGIQSNDFSHKTYDTIVNGTQMSTNINLTDNNLITHCLCCSQASYRVLALDINIMNKCCMNKMYSLRTLTIKNQF